MSLEENTITFGKYKDLTLEYLLKDRKYCEWLIDQEWFKEKHEYLYNKVLNHNPSEIFIGEIKGNGDDIFSYKFFNLISPDNKRLDTIEERDKKCYEYYYKLLKDIQQQIRENLSDPSINPYNIKAPTKWLQKFEEKYGISRDVFKEFIFSNDLPNITSVIEYVKKFGGLSYKGAKSFIIGKKNSLDQENYWQQILKKKYGEDISCQFKYKNCIFDFIHIKHNILYECKLGLKDFDEKQYKKYLLALEDFSIIYLIGKDIVIDMKEKKVFCLSSEKFTNDIIERLGSKNRTRFDLVISEFEVVKVTEFFEI